METQDGIVVGARQGKTLLADRWWLMLAAADSPGGMAMMEVALPAGAPATRPHRHREHDEIWYILEGALTFRLGTREVVAGPGTCVAAPRGTIHQLHNATDAAVRYLTMSTPGTQMSYFEELGALMTAAPTGRAEQGVWDALAAKYDVEFCDLPPLADAREA